MRAGRRCPVVKFGLGAEGLVKGQISSSPSSGDAQTPPSHSDLCANLSYKSVYYKAIFWNDM